MDYLNSIDDIKSENSTIQSQINQITKQRNAQLKGIF
jgi:hypothetical protein